MNSLGRVKASEMLSQVYVQEKKWGLNGGVSRSIQSDSVFGVGCSVAYNGFSVPALMLPDRRGKLGQTLSFAVVF